MQEQFTFHRSYFFSHAETFQPRITIAITAHELVLKVRENLKHQIVELTLSFHARKRLTGISEFVSIIWLHMSSFTSIA